LCCGFCAQALSGSGAAPVAKRVVQATSVKALACGLCIFVMGVLRNATLEIKAVGMASLLVSVARFQKEDSLDSLGSRVCLVYVLYSMKLILRLLVTNTNTPQINPFQQGSPVPP